MERMTKTAASTLRDAAGIPAMICEKRTTAAIYRKLLGELPDSCGEKLKHMFWENIAHANCLNGIYCLITGVCPGIQPISSRQASAAELLQQCCASELQALAACEARYADSRFGPVYRELAAESRAHCRVVLELLGSLAD